MSDASVDLVLCDLPYGVTDNKWDSVIPLDRLWAAYKRLLKPTGAVVLTATQPFASALVTSNPKWFRHEWIWRKSNIAGFLNAHRKPLSEHESVLVFAPTKRPVYNPQGLQSYNKVRRRGKPSSNYSTYRRDHLQEFTNYPKSILEIPSERGLHPTQKPTALFEYLIRTYTQPGALVLDNCMGSGTTAIACLNSGRDFIGFESDLTYYAIAEKRIAEWSNDAVQIPCAS